MDTRRTSAGVRLGSIYSNFRHIRRLRRKIRDLEIEATELRQRLAMIMEDFNANMFANNQLRFCQQQIEEQMQLQDMLNGSVEQEIVVLRQLIQQDQQAATEFLSNSVANTSQIGARQYEELEQNQDVNAMRDHRSQEAGNARQDRRNQEAGDEGNPNYQDFVTGGLNSHDQNVSTSSSGERTSGNNR